MMRLACCLDESWGFGGNFYKPALHRFGVGDLVFNFHTVHDFNIGTIFIRGIDSRDSHFKAMGHGQRIDPFTGGSMMGVYD